MKYFKLITLLLQLLFFVLLLVSAIFMDNKSIGLLSFASLLIISIVNIFLIKQKENQFTNQLEELTPFYKIIFTIFFISLLVLSLNAFFEFTILSNKVDNLLIFIALLTFIIVCRYFPYIPFYRD